MSAKPIDYSEIRAKGLADWRETTDTLTALLKHLDGLADIVRLSDSVLNEQTPLDVRVLFNTINNLRNKLHRRPRQKGNDHFQIRRMSSRS